MPTPPSSNTQHEAWSSLPKLPVLGLVKKSWHLVTTHGTLWRLMMIFSLMVLVPLIFGTYAVHNMAGGGRLHGLLYLLVTLQILSSFSRLGADAGAFSIALPVLDIALGRDTHVRTFKDILSLAYLKPLFFTKRFLKIVLLIAGPDALTTLSFALIISLVPMIVGWDQPIMVMWGFVILATLLLLTYAVTWFLPAYLATRFLLAYLTTRFLPLYGTLADEKPRPLSRAWHLSRKSFWRLFLGRKVITLLGFLGHLMLMLTSLFTPTLGGKLLITLPLAAWVGGLNIFLYVYYGLAYRFLEDTRGPLLDSASPASQGAIVKAEQVAPAPKQKTPQKSPSASARKTPSAKTKAKPRTPRKGAQKPPPQT